MPLDFGLLGKPVNPLEALQAYGAAHQMRQQQEQLQRKEQERQQEAQRLARLQAGLTGAYDLTTGRMDPAAARSAFIGAGDVEGAMKFDAGLSEQQAAQAKRIHEQRTIGLRLLDQANDPASYAQARELAKQYGFDISTIPEQYDPAFVQKARAELNALEPDKMVTPTAALQELAAMGVDPASPEGREILIAHLNPPAYQVFGDDLIQTRGPGVTGGGGGGGTGGGGSGIVAANNHGAIKDGPFARSQPGYTGSSGGFAQFESKAAGDAAQTSLLKNNYLSRGYDTPAEIVHRYAPVGPENSAASVNNYANFIAQKLGIGQNDQISEAQLPQLVAAMQTFETGGKGGSSPRVVATKPSDEKPQGVRMTPAEVQAEGLDPKMVYYRGTDGIPKAVSGQAKSEGKTDAPYSQSAIDAFNRAIDTAGRLGKHPGLNAAVGAKGVSGGLLGGWVVPGTNAADFTAELEAMKAQVFLPMVQSMKGMGALSNAEGEKLTTAIGALSVDQSEGQFKQSLERIIGDLTTYRNRGMPKPTAAPSRGWGKAVVVKP